MTNAQRIAAQLHPVARTTLINTPARRGATVVLPEGPLRRDLEAAGLIGTGHGLTELGIAVRRIVVNESLDSAF